MQKSEAFIHFEWRRKWYRLFQNSITAVQKEGDTPLTVSFPAAEEATKMIAQKLGGARFCTYWNSTGNANDSTYYEWCRDG